MAGIDDIVAQMRRNPEGIRFTDASRVCDHYFGQPRQGKSSHRVYKTPGQGDPRINIQNAKGKTKACQVNKILRAIERLEHESHSK